MQGRGTGSRSPSSVLLILVVVAVAAIAVSALPATAGSPAQPPPNLAGPPAEAPPTDLPPVAAPPADEERELPEGRGWYTAAQAAEGREAYLEHCAECHSPDLRARSTYISLYRFPALTGEYFWDRWRGQNVHALQLVIQHTMPLGAPNSLGGDTYTAITAYILEVNGFRAGPRALPPAGDAPEVLMQAIIDPAVTGPQARAQMVGLRPDAGPVEEPDTAVPPEEQEQQAFEIDPAPDAAPEPEPEPDDEPDEEVRAEWYTGAQAERARDLYRVHCSRCHGAALQGIGVAPSLAGDNFLARWEGRSLADMLEVIVDAMPVEQPELVGLAGGADLVALILSHNGFPAGHVELPANVGQLEPFVVERERAEVSDEEPADEEPQDDEPPDDGAGEAGDEAGAP